MKKKNLASLLIVCGLVIILIASAVLPAFAATLEDAGVKTITLEEAKELAVKNNFDLSKTEIARMKLFRDEDDLLSKAYDAAFLVQAGISIAGKDLYNQVVDGLEVVRMSQKAIEEGQEVQRKLIKYAAEVQYLMLLSGEKQIEHLEKNLAKLEKNVQVEKLKTELGLSSASKLEDSSFQLYQLQIGLRQLKNQSAKNEVQFKKLIGYPLDRQLKLAEVDAGLGELPDYQDGLSNALNNGLQIRNAARDLQRKQDYTKAVEERHSLGSADQYKADLDLSEAKLYLEEITLRTEENYNCAYRDLLSSRENLAKAIKEAEIGERDYRFQQIKYDLGLSGKLELQIKQLDYEQKIIAKGQAKDQYLLAKTAYDLAREGIISMH